MIIGALSSQAFSVPSTMTYQGRIIKSDGTPLQHNSVSFTFSITDPGGLCILYREVVNGLDMSNSKGVFDVQVGGGTRLFPTGPAPFTVLDSLSNLSSMPCQGGTTYTPAIDDGRRLRVQFYDGVGWKVISPDNIIRSVPYAGHAAFAITANTANKFDGKALSEFVLKGMVPICTTGTFLSWDGNDFTCEAGVGGGGGGGGGAVTNTATLSNGNIWIGDASNKAQQYSMSGDATLSNSGVLKLAADSVNSSKIVDGSVGVSDLNFAGVMSANTGLVVRDGNQFYNKSCTLGQILSWTASGWDCSAITFSETDPKVGTNTTNYLSKWDGSKLVTSAVFEDSGNVGIGTSNPQAKLDVNGVIRATDICDENGANCKDLSMGWGNTGLLGIADGGTNSSTALINNRLMASIGGAIKELGALDDGQIVVGKTGNAPQLVTMSGDAAISNTGALTIATSAVNSAKIADGTVGVIDLNFAGTMSVNTGLVVRDGTQFYNKTCSGNEVLIWSVANGWICSTVVTTETDPKIGSNTINYISKWDGTKIVSSALYESGGSFGIGTSSPSATLNIVDASSNATLRLQNTSAGRSSSIGFRDAAGNNKAYVEWANSSYGGPFGTNSFSLFTLSSDPLAFGTNNSERLRITSGGNVGIGTSTPANKLSVAGVIESTTGGIRFPDGSIQTTATGGGSGGTMLSNWPDAVRCTNGTMIWHLVLGNGPWVDGRYYYSGAGEWIGYNSDGTYYSSSGQLSSYSCVTSALSITALYSAGQAFNFVGGGSNLWTASGVNTYFGGGNVGIGTTTPGSKLDVNGAINMASSTETAAASTNSAASYTIPDLTRNVRRIDLTANTTLTLPAISGLATDATYTLTVRVKQDATGSRTLAWAGNGNTIKWDSGFAVAPASGPNQITVYQFFIIGGETTWLGSMVWREN